MSDLSSVFHLIGLFTAGFGAIFFLADRHSRTSRALALCLAALGVRLLLAPLELSHPTIAITATARLLEALTIVAVMEWARRVAETVARRLGRAARGLLLAAQIMTLIYSGLALGYLLIDPQQALSGATGFFRVRAMEWALFAPVLGTAVLLSTIGILLLVFGRTDPAESIRLRALMAASPFLFAGLLVQVSVVPFVIALGLLIFLFGSVRYLMVLGRRGAWMSQFLAPEVASLVRLKGVEQVLRRERRAVSAVFCDLRGFTAYTEANDSEAVMVFLEHYYAEVGALAARHGATVKDHAGDGVLLLLGAPVAQDDHAQRAVQLALALQGALRVRLAEAGLALGIGVASGEVTVGAMQGAGRLEYVAVGRAINLAARLCARAEAGEVWAEASTVESLNPEWAARFAARTPELFKGFDAAVTPYAVLA